MKTINIVIGANYGDEGKGLVTNIITNRSDVVVLANGGAQRGHTVEYNGCKHIFHHFGSAALKGARSHASELFLLNPAEYIKELDDFENNLHCKPSLTADPNCKVTTIYDMLANAIREELKGTKGSCGMGVWETIQRYDETINPLNAYWYKYKDYVNSTVNSWKNELNKIKEYYIHQNWIVNSNSKLVNYFYNPDLIEHFISDLARMVNNVGCRQDFLIYSRYDNITIECAQGLAIDKNADKVNGTPTYTGSYNLLPFIVSEDDIQINRYYVRNPN